MERLCTVEDCTQALYAKGHCNMHYKRIRQYGSLEDPRLTFEERFWAKVDKSGDCWTWTATRNSAGYGTTTIDGVHRYSHRASYEMANGPIPAGMQIDHMCHSRSCVNPGHLRVVTGKQNMEHLSGPKSSSKSGVRGVYLHESGKWRVQVTHNRRRYSGGSFENMADAEASAIALRNKLFTHNDVDRIAA